jgi:hypothetical protein
MEAPSRPDVPTHATIRSAYNGECIRFGGGIRLEARYFPQELCCTESHPSIREAFSLMAALTLEEHLSDDSRSACTADG